MSGLTTTGAKFRIVVKAWISRCMISPRTVSVEIYVEQ